MPIVSPFHSIQQPYGLINMARGAVYHNHSDCTEGNNIEPQYWAAGTGGHRLCEHCARLGGGLLASGMFGTR
jgi:hypothetical protein